MAKFYNKPLSSMHDPSSDSDVVANDSRRNIRLLFSLSLLLSATDSDDMPFITTIIYCFITIITNIDIELK